jgi:ethanolamine permease
MPIKLESGIKRSPLWVLSFGLNLVAGGQMIFWVDGFRFGFYNTLGAFLILFSAYFCLTFCLAEISSCLPFSGGSYALARVTGGPLIGFVVGCADRIDLLANISLHMMIASWIVTHSIGIAQVYAQIICWIIIYVLACFNLWKPSSELHWWVMAASLVSYVIVFVIFLVGCSATAEFGNGLTTTSTLAITGLDFISLFPICTFFFSGLQFIQISAVDVVDPKENIPRLLITVTIGAFVVGLMLLFLVASHSPIDVFYSDKFPLTIVPALSSVLTNSSPKLIALMLVPIFLAAFQGNLFAIHRVSMAMLQSNLLVVIRPSSWKFVADDQFELIRIGVFIMCGMIIGFSLLREQWFWIVAQVAMLGTMTSQCANLISFIVFRVQFGSLDRGFVSLLGIAGALYPLMVFILVVIGIVARGWDGRIAMCLYLFLLMVSGIVYGCRLQAQQRFSAEEEAALFVAHVIRHNAQKSRRLKLRASRAASMTRSHSSMMLLAGSTMSFRGAVTKESGGLHALHGSPSFMERKRLKTGADGARHGSPSFRERKRLKTGDDDDDDDDESSYSSHSPSCVPAAVSTFSNAPVSQAPKKDFIPQDSGATGIGLNATTSVPPSSNDNSSDGVKPSVPTANDEIAAHSLSNIPSTPFTDAAITHSTKVAVQRTVSHWQVPRKVLAIALNDEENLLDGASNVKSSLAVDSSPSGRFESSPKGTTTASGVPSAFHAAAQAFLSHGDTASSKRRRLDRRKEAVIRAFKQSSDIQRKPQQGGHFPTASARPGLKVKPGVANMFRVTAPTAQQHHQRESGGIISSANLENQQTPTHAPTKLTSAAAHVMAAKHWAKLNILTHPFQAYQQNDDEDFDEEDQTYTERRPNKGTRLSGKDRPLPSITVNSDIYSDTLLYRNTESNNMNGSGACTPSNGTGGGEELAIADIKKNDLIDRYYSEDQFNYHAFLDDVFGGTKNSQVADGSNPANKNRKIAPLTAAVQAAIAASRFQAVKTGKLTQGSQSVNNTSSDTIDTQFIGRKLRRALPPTQRVASGSAITLDSKAAAGGGKARLQAPPSLEAVNPAVMEREMAAATPVTPTLHHMENYLRKETSVSVQGHIHFEEKVNDVTVEEENNRFSPYHKAHS